jgi:hypothetical protein
MGRFMSYEITSIDDLIAALGGDTEVADWLGISQPAVGMWKSRGHIGSGWHLRLLAECRRRGLTVDPQVFGLHERDVGDLFRPLVSSGAVVAA